jgi:hypothetical protein
MIIWQTTMKNKTNKNHHHTHNNNSRWLYVNNKIDEKSVFTSGRTVEGRLDMIKFTNCLAITD